MFGRTFSFWRRLVGRGDSAAPAAHPEAERRVWIRHPTDLETQVHLAGRSNPDRFVARVCDISRGGVQLLANRAFQPGDLLSVELPVPVEQGSDTVLACVVRVTQRGPGEWSLGCVFSCELEQDELESLGGKRQKHSSSDQRTWMRFPSRIKAVYQPVGADDPSKHPAEVLNISASGVGLIVSRSVETGTLLSIDLAPPTAGARPRTMLACVVHASSQSPSEWALGCNFIQELGEEDLQALVPS